VCFIVATPLLIATGDCYWCRLDIGDAPYAANVHIDRKGRVILWLWMRDPRPAPPLCPPSDTCGCLAIPRILTYVDNVKIGQDNKPIPAVFQHPIPEVMQLRGTQHSLDIPPQKTVPEDSLRLLHTFDSSHFEAKLQFTRYGLSCSHCIVFPSTPQQSLLVLLSM
jgi:sucrose-6-phosphate hydrolase SacC (GH32 family)